MLVSGVLFDGGRNDYPLEERIKDTQRQSELLARRYANADRNAPVPAVINLDITPNNFHLLENRIHIPEYDLELTGPWIPIANYDGLKFVYDSTHLANVAIDFQGLSKAALSELGPRIGFLHRSGSSEFEYKSFTEWAQALGIRVEGTEGRIS